MRLFNGARWWRNSWFWLGILPAAALLRGLWVHVMDVDASQYASISMEMLQNGHWLQVQHRGADYLDKPPLLFWASAASFALFGLHDWSYKLPSLLAALAGVYGLYRFARLYYPETTARNAAFILASSLGFVVICNDVRTDTLLLGTAACAVWLLAEYLERPRWSALAGAFACVGLAMLAKGPIGLVAPAFALGSHILLQRRWSAIFRPQWLAGLALALLVLAPMCWGLYQQFDLHPEKSVNGRTGVSGLYFFFWEQSFGRITGENVWKNDTSAFYFVHVLGWAFLPWVLLFYPVLIKKLVDLARAGFRLKPGAEGYSLGGFVLTFAALSMSHYKLPHYIFITLPWAALLTAQGLDKPAQAGRRWPWYVLYLTAALLLGVAFLAPGWIFADAPWWLWSVLLGLSAGLLYRIFRNPAPADASVLVQRGIWAVGIALFVLNFHFYPRLLPFQSTSTVAEWAHNAGIPAERLFFYHRHGHALDYYSGRILEGFDSTGQIGARAAREGAIWVYTDAEGKAEIDTVGMNYTVEKRFEHFQVALLNTRFLNPTTRSEALEPVFLLKFERESEQ